MEAILKQSSNPVNQENQGADNVPQLRFPDFHREWNKIQIGNVTTKIGSGVTPRGGSGVYTNSGILFIRSQNVNHDRLILEEVVYIPEDIHEKMKGSEVHSSDILLNITGASIGRSCVVPDNFHVGNVNQHVCIVRLKKEQIPKFYQAILSSHRGQKLVYQGQAGGGREGLNFQSIRTFKIFVPSLPEQQKIAAFLSVIDQKIQQLTHKNELLEQYKKGVMQKLFSQEIRFKQEDGSDYPDWEEKRLGDVIEFANGKAHEQNIDENGNFIVVNSKFISSEGNVKKYCNSQIFPLIKGDIVMVMSDVPNGKALAKCYLIEKDGVYTLNQRICALKKKTCFNEFLIYLVNRNKYYLKFDSGVGQTNLKKKEVLNCPLTIPMSLDEQGIIAKYVSKIEHNLELINNQITQTQQFKKGLLQQMFV